MSAEWTFMQEFPIGKPYWHCQSYHTREAAIAAARKYYSPHYRIWIGRRKQYVKKELCLLAQKKS